MKKIAFIIILFALFIPMIQDLFNIIKPRQLAGVVVLTEKPELNFKNWWSGGYQNNYNEYNGENFGLRNAFIRLYNQIDFSTFKKPHGNVVVGKQNYLFQSEYINEITGANFIGDGEMKMKLENLKKTQDFLDSKNIFLLTVLAPGKSDYYKEYLPEYYSDKFTDRRNYNLILKYGQEENIRFIDLNKLFLQIKDTSTYPLFPKHGIHWNNYGVAIATDTITKYIEDKKGIALSNISWTMAPSETLQGTDYDLGDLLNIYQELPYDKLSYPKFTITDDSLAVKPRLLVIADSFYWPIFFSEVFKKVFSNETYYYYCSSINPQNGPSGNFVSDLNFFKEIKKFDVILLLQSSGNYHNPGVGFVQWLNADLKRQEEFRMKSLAKVKEDKLLSSRVNQIANELKISTDSAQSIITDSIVGLRFDALSKYKIEMRNDPEWMKQLYQKADQTGKSLDEVMQGDAEWLYDQQSK